MLSLKKSFSQQQQKLFALNSWNQSQSTTWQFSWLNRDVIGSQSHRQKAHVDKGLRQRFQILRVRTAICRIYKKNILNFILLLQLASRDYLPDFSPLNNLYHTPIEATIVPAGAARSCCQVSPDTWILQLSSPRGSSQIPQLRKAKIWI